MRLEFEIGENEKLKLIIERDSFTGRFDYYVNDSKYQIRSPFNFFTHFSLSLKKEYSFEIGNNEKHNIKIEHIRPLFFAGFRPHTYNIYDNGKLLKAYTGL